MVALHHCHMPIALPLRRCSFNTLRAYNVAGPDGSRYLFNGAALNKTMYLHSFTLVQQVDMRKHLESS